MNNKQSLFYAMAQQLAKYSSYCEAMEIKPTRTGFYVWLKNQ